MQPLDSLRFMLIGLDGRVNEHQRDVIDYVQEENRVLREQMGDKRLRLNDDPRRRLSVKAKKLGRQALSEAASLVTADTLLRWHRKLIARKYDGSPHRGLGRPRVMERKRRLAASRARLSGRLSIVRPDESAARRQMLDRHEEAGSRGPLRSKTSGPGEVAALA